MLWFDGALHAETVVPFDLADRGLLLGDGVFDTSLVRAGKMVWREAHLARLSAACETLGFTLDEAAVVRAIDALTGAMPDGVMRITVTRGAGPRGLAAPPTPAPTTFASIAPMRPGFAFAPVTLGVTSIRRNETSPTARLKMLNYADAIVASRDALRAGYDDALFLNTKGYVACATVGNLMVITGDRLLTPPLTDGVLPGITRDKLLHLAPSLGLMPRECSLRLEDLMSADAVFITNSLRLISPVTRIDGVATSGHDQRVTTLTEALRRVLDAD